MTSTQRHNTGEAANAFLRVMDPQPFMAIQQRNLEAFTKMSTAVGQAMASIGEKQLEMLKSLTALPAPSRSRPGPNSGFSELLEGQIQSGRAILETTTQQMRDVHDVVRDCYSEVASELEACARDNLKSIGSSVGTATSQASRSMEQAGQAASQAVAKAQRATSQAVTRAAE